MEFRILADLPSNDTLRLNKSSYVALLGSCFAEGIGQRLTDALPDGHTLVNPFGVIYNPLSICRCLNFLLDLPSSADKLSCATSLLPYIFEGRDGLWHSWLHTSHFSASTREDCLEKIVPQLISARNFFERTDLLCLTWGTSYIYELMEDGLVVTNCHKEPARTFTRRRTTIEEITMATINLIGRFRKLHPSLSVLLTVSPYRYAGSGIHKSTLSKSILHLAAERICDELPYVYYFPAYEIVIDELRDYRFFEADMLHPSAVATDYVWERFCSWCFTPDLEHFAADKLKLLRQARHRPLI